MKTRILNFVTIYFFVIKIRQPLTTYMLHTRYLSSNVVFWGASCLVSDDSTSFEWPVIPEYKIVWSAHMYIPNVCSSLLVRKAPTMERTTWTPPWMCPQCAGKRSLEFAVYIEREYWTLNTHFPTPSLTSIYSYSIIYQYSYSKW